MMGWRHRMSPSRARPSQGAGTASCTDWSHLCGGPTDGPAPQDVPPHTVRVPQDAYSKFVSEGGGHTNAYTAAENTNYSFDINWDSLEPALERFACFFTCPLISKDGVDREINAVVRRGVLSVLSVLSVLPEGTDACAWCRGGRRAQARTRERGGERQALVCTRKRLGQAQVPNLPCPLLHGASAQRLPLRTAQGDRCRCAGLARRNAHGEQDANRTAQTLGCFPCLVRGATRMWRA